MEIQGDNSGDNNERKKIFRKCAQEVWDQSFRYGGKVKYEELLMEGPLQTLVANKLLVIESQKSIFSNAEEYRYLEKHFKEVVHMLADEQLQRDQQQCLSNSGAEKKLDSAAPQLSTASPQPRPSIPLPSTDRAVQQQSAEALVQRGRAPNLSVPRRSYSHVPSPSATRSMNSTHQQSSFQSSTSKPCAAPPLAAGSSGVQASFVASANSSSANSVAQYGTMVSSAPSLLYSTVLNCCPSSFLPSAPAASSHPITLPPIAFVPWTPPGGVRAGEAEASKAKDAFLTQASRLLARQMTPSSLSHFVGKLPPTQIPAAFVAGSEEDAQSRKAKILVVVCSSQRVLGRVSGPKSTQEKLYVELTGKPHDYLEYIMECSSGVVDHNGVQTAATSKKILDMAKAIL